MVSSTPRLRMFAGPNGSGKSTIKTELNPHWIGIYVNADEIEAAFRANPNGLDLSAFDVDCTQQELVTFLQGSSQAALGDIGRHLGDIRFTESFLTVPQDAINSYVAASVAEFLRQKLLERRANLSFETVMSHRSKIELFKKAKELGYKTYLYYVSTDSPLINIARIDHRRDMGGHWIPPETVKSRYIKSMELLIEAVALSDRAFIFDNSGTDLQLIAEFTCSDQMTIKYGNVPTPKWFETYVESQLIE